MQQRSSGDQQNGGATDRHGVHRLHFEQQAVTPRRRVTPRLRNADRSKHLATQELQDNRRTETRTDRARHYLSQYGSIAQSRTPARAQERIGWHHLRKSNSGD
jgi:hypothetical protein